MKKNLAQILFVMAAFFLYGCPNDGPYEMYTRINADGSCYREFVRNADSTFVAGDTTSNPFPMKLDSSWNISFYKRMAGDSSKFKNYPASHVTIEKGVEYAWFATARKEYASVQDLADNFAYDHSDWRSLKPVVELKTKFRWFYTYYHFNETYPAFDPFKIVPITEYLSREEVTTLYGENQNLYKGNNGFENSNMLKDLEKRADQWLNRNFFEEVFALYLKHYSLFKDVPVDSATFALSKDSLLNYYEKKDTVDFFKEDFNLVLDRYFKTDAFTKAKTDETDKLFEEEFPKFMKYSGVEVNYRMSLPGKIIETNAPFLSNDTLSWKITDYRFYFNDYAITAVSRRPNIWAFAMTGLIIVMAVIGLLIKRKPD